MVFKEILLFHILLITLCVHIEARSVDGIRSDIVETKFGPDPQETKILYNEDASSLDDNPKKPGWMVRLAKYFKFPKRRTQLMRFGDITSRVSNNLGGSAMKIAAIVEKLCKMLKMVIPIVAAVCNVGQFQFCMQADAPTQLSEAMSRPMGTMDLNVPDK